MKFAIDRDLRTWRKTEVQIQGQGQPAPSASDDSGKFGARGSGRPTVAEPVG